MTIREMLEAHLYGLFGYRDKRFHGPHPGQGMIFDFGDRGHQACFAKLSCRLDPQGQLDVNISQGIKPTPELLNELRGWTTGLTSDASHIHFAFWPGRFGSLKNVTQALTVPDPDRKSAWNFARKELQEDFRNLEVALEKFFAKLDVSEGVRHAATEDAAQRFVGLGDEEFVAGAIAEGDGCGYYTEDLATLSRISFEGEQVLFHFPFTMAGESRSEETMWHPISGELVLSVPWSSVQSGKTSGFQQHASSFAQPDRE